MTCNQTLPGNLADWVTASVGLHSQSDPFISTDITPGSCSDSWFTYWSLSAPLNVRVYTFSTIQPAYWLATKQFHLKQCCCITYQHSVTACVWILPEKVPSAVCNCNSLFSQDRKCWTAARVFLLCHSSVWVPIWQINFESITEYSWIKKNIK